MHNINHNIPGWNNPRILRVLSEYASKVPENGNILELGALFGRSTYALGHNKHPSVKLWVIDLWGTLYLKDFVDHYLHDEVCPHAEKLMIESKLKTNPDRLDSEDFFELWKHWTTGIPNLEARQGFTTMSHQDFPQMDLIIQDAGHSYRDVYDDLTHWLPKLKEGGTIIVDDYDKNGFQEVIDAVNQFSYANDMKLHMVTERNVALTR